MEYILYRIKSENYKDSHQTKEEIPLFQKLGYSLTDFGGNVFFVSIGSIISL
jgi:Na+/melibiose symporter-like transporter